MAWNPSPEVQVARDAANRLASLCGELVKQVIVLYVTDNSLGIVSYGATQQLCGQAKKLSDKLYKAAYEHFEQEAP